MSPPPSLPNEKRTCDTNIGPSIAKVPYFIIIVYCAWFVRDYDSVEWTLAMNDTWRMPCGKWPMKMKLKSQFEMHDADFWRSLFKQNLKQNDRMKVKWIEIEQMSHGQNDDKSQTLVSVLLRLIIITSIILLILLYLIWYNFWLIGQRPIWWILYAFAIILFLLRGVWRKINNNKSAVWSFIHLVAHINCYGRL